MKYSGSDFKMTSQANHLAKLLNLLGECQRQSFHMQRLYKRRYTNSKGYIKSNWTPSFGYGVNYDIVGYSAADTESSSKSITINENDEVVYDGGDAH